MVVWASQVKNLPASAGDTGYMSLIPALARSPGEGNGNPLQHSCLENSHGQMYMEAYSPWGGKELDVTEQLITAQHTCVYFMHLNYGILCF